MIEFASYIATVMVGALGLFAAMVGVSKGLALLYVRARRPVRPINRPEGEARNAQR